MKRKHILGRISGITLLAFLSLFINQLLSSPERQDDVTSLHNQRTDIIEIHFIDVGQGDSILIETSDASMLIDAGENNKGTVVINYLKAQSIEKLDYVIGTHPHSDHIGGLDTVIKSIPVDNIILPPVSHTTQTYEEVLEAIEDADLQITMPVVGDKYTLGPATFTIIAPNSDDYQNLNNYSVGIKLTYGNNSFVFTGDAEALAEKEMLKNGLDLSADVFKLAHHGSNTSNSVDFLDEVDPTFAIISAGIDNEYGHPHSEVLQELSLRNTRLYRTDLQGTVVFTSDGKTISVNTSEYKLTEDDLLND